MGILWFVWVLGLGGCAATENVLVSAKNYTQGAFYLQHQNYTDCITTFETEVAENPSNASAHFYLGRCYLTVEENHAALQQLKKAVNFDQDNPNYYFWKGVAYAANDNAQLERQDYERVLKLEPDHIQALVYLGHNHLEAGHPRIALGYYNRALKIDPAIAPASFNRALALRTRQRTLEEINAWQTYLRYYPNGAFARQAVSYLNRYGRFDFRNHTIGRRTLSLAKVRFAPSSAQISKESLPTLQKLAQINAQNQELADARERLANLPQDATEEERHQAVQDVRQARRDVRQARAAVAERLSEGSAMGRCLTYFKMLPSRVA